MDFSLFKPNLINMKAHSGTCSCSVELCKQWYLWRIFSQTGIFAGFSLRMYIYIAGPVGYYTGAHTVIFRGVFSLYYSPEGRAKLRWAGREGGHCIF